MKTPKNIDVLFVEGSLKRLKVQANYFVRISASSSTTS